MIEFCQVSASYDGELAILRDVSFTVSDGDFVAFVGTNGAGKSTTMRLINGLLKPTSGEVLIDGVPTSQLKTSELASKVGFLFQNPDRQICCKTVREELLFGFAAQGRAGAEAEAKVDAMIERFVVLDEPTTGLDFRECTKVMEVVSGLNARGTTVVMVCHDMEVVGDYVTHVIAMTAGQVVADGATFDVLRDEGEAYARKLIEAGVHVACVRYNNTHHDFMMLNALAETTPTRAAVAQAAAALKKMLH